jgi:hypothetical protein
MMLLIGDLTNLIGCILTQQLPFQVTLSPSQLRLDELITS